MQSLSYAHSWPVISRTLNGSDFKYTGAAVSNSQWVSSLKTKNASFAVSHGCHFFSGDERFFRRGYLLDLKLGRAKRGKMVITMAASDYYSTLQVSKTATKRDITVSYRKLARQYHPDINKSPGAEENFKKIAAAYEVLSDDEKRSLYDQFGEEGVRGASGDSSASPSRVDPFDLFESIFSGSKGAFDGFGDTGGTSFKVRHGGRQKGDDIRFDLSLSFKEAIFGVVKDIEINRLETCGICMGSGARSGTNVKTCQDCGGKGNVRESQRTPYGMYSQVSTCTKCRGEGKVITNPCYRCGGDSRVRSKKTINLKIPPGVIGGITLQVSGEGHSGPKGGPTGDLYVFLDVKKMPGIEREGVNLHSKITINYTEAILGTVVKVETVEGFKDLEVPAGTQPGEELAMRNMGVPILRNPSARGDHLFIVNVAIPRKLSDLERKLVEELAQLNRSSRFFSNFSRRGDQSNKQEQKNKLTTDSKASAQENGKGSSFWDLIKNMARWKRSRNKFGSLSLQATVLEYPFVASPNSTLTYHFFSPPMSLLVLFICIVFLFRYIKKISKRWKSSCTFDNPEKNALT